MILRLRAETMPSVTEPPSPNGLPIAITQSPTRMVSELPNGTAISGLAGSGVTLRTARSVSVSRPFTSAFSVVPSAKLTSISSASSMTWLLVMMMPCAASSTKPDPSEFTRRDGELRPSGWSLNRSSKKSRNGEPGGRSGIGTGCCWPDTFWLVEIFTTAGESRAARSATELGP